MKNRNKNKPEFSHSFKLKIITNLVKKSKESKYLLI